MRKMRNPHILTVFFVVFVATGLFLLGYFVGRAGMPEVVETIKIDTLYYEKPQPVKVEARPVMVRVPQILFAERVVEVEGETKIVKVATGQDSVDLAVNIETLQYEDSTYRAQVSGPRIGQYGPQLDWFETYSRTTTQTVTKRNRFAVTAGAGVGLTPKGILPMVGVSAGVVLWSK